MADPELIDLGGVTLTRLLELQAAADGSIAVMEAMLASATAQRQLLEQLVAEAREVESSALAVLVGAGAQSGSPPDPAALPGLSEAEVESAR